MVRVTRLEALRSAYFTGFDAGRATVVREECECVKFLCDKSVSV